MNLFLLFLKLLNALKMLKYNRNKILEKMDTVPSSSAAIFSIWQTCTNTGDRVREQGRIHYFFFVSSEMKILHYKNNLHNNRNK